MMTQGLDRPAAPTRPAVAPAPCARLYGMPQGMFGGGSSLGTAASCTCHVAGVIQLAWCRCRRWRSTQSGSRAAAISAIHRAAPCAVVLADQCAPEQPGYAAVGAPQACTHMLRTVNISGRRVHAPRQPWQRSLHAPRQLRCRSRGCSYCTRRGSCCRSHGSGRCMRHGSCVVTAAAAAKLLHARRSSCSHSHGSSRCSVLQPLHASQQLLPQARQRALDVLHAPRQLLSQSRQRPLCCTHHKLPPEPRPPRQGCCRSHGSGRYTRHSSCCRSHGSGRCVRHSSCAVAIAAVAIARATAAAVTATAAAAVWAARATAAAVTVAPAAVGCAIAAVPLHAPL